MKKIISIVLALSLFLLTVLPVSAEEKSSQSATGLVSFVDDSGVKHWVVFHVQEAKARCKKVKKTVVDCSGKGFTIYANINGDFAKVEINLVNIEGRTAYFAGPVVSSKNPDWMGFWFFIKVIDSGKHRSNSDKIWLDLTTEADARSGVMEKRDPFNGPFNIQKGFLIVD